MVGRDLAALRFLFFFLLLFRRLFLGYLLIMLLRRHALRNSSGLLPIGLGLLLAASLLRILVS